MKASDHYHDGIVVDDFDATLALLAEVGGYRWCHEWVGKQTIWTPEGQRTISLRATYSTSEPRLEIVETVPGTVWTPSTSGIHHLGYWSDDLVADESVLEREGFSTEAKQLAPDGTPMWLYAKAPGGPRIELVSRAVEPAMSVWFATGRMPTG